MFYFLKYFIVSLLSTFSGSHAIQVPVEDAKMGRISTLTPKRLIVLWRQQHKCTNDYIRQKMMGNREERYE